MSNRFDIIEIFKPTKDFIDCPVEIEKWAILYDKKKNSLVLQVKLRNLSTIPIKMVTVQIFSASNGEPLNTKEPFDYTYSACNKFGDFFGDDKAIELSSNTITDVDILISKVVLSDDMIWRLTDEKIISINSQVKIPSAFFKQFVSDSIKSSETKFRYMPTENGEFWQCCCGKNNVSENCKRCNSSKKEIFTLFNTNNLTSNFETYINDQLIANKEKALDSLQLSRKRKKRILYVIRITVLIMILFVLAWSTTKAVNEVRFRKAISLIEDYNYAKAVEIFNALPEESYEYKIEDLLEAECENIFEDFQSRKISFERATNYLSAINTYKSINDVTIYDSENEKRINAVKDSKRKIENLNTSRDAFSKGKKYMEEGNYINAISCFQEIILTDSDYDLAQKKEKDCREALTQETNLKLKNYQDTKDYVSALKLIDKVREYTVKNNEFENYVKYFNALEKGEEALAEGVYYDYPDDLYSSPNLDSDTGKCFTSSGDANVYDYYIDDNFCVWYKVRSSSGTYYWIK